MRKSLGFDISLNEVKNTKKKKKKEDTTVEKGVFHMPKLDDVVKAIDEREAELMARVEESHDWSYRDKVKSLILLLFDLLSSLLNIMPDFIQKLKKHLKVVPQKNNLQKKYNTYYYTNNISCYTYNFTIKIIITT